MTASSQVVLLLHYHLLSKATERGFLYLFQHMSAVESEFKNHALQMLNNSALLAVGAIFNDGSMSMIPLPNAGGRVGWSCCLFAIARTSEGVISWFKTSVTLSRSAQAGIYQSRQTALSEKE
jgi:hypothetical protein